MDSMDRKIENKGKARRRIVYVSMAAVVFLAILYVIIFGDKSSRLNVDTDRITIEEVRADVFQDYIAVIGTTNPIRTIYLDAMEGGRVEEILLEEGSMLKEGNVIVRLSNTNLLLDIMFRESELAERENNLRTTRLQMEQNKLTLRSQLLEIDYQFQTQQRLFEKNEALFQARHISQEEYEKSKEQVDYLSKRRQLLVENQVQDSIFRGTQVRQLEESIDRMHQNLRMIKKKLDDLDVKAPAEGLLASLNVEIGESVSSGFRLGQVHILDAYKLQVEIDEHYISRVARGLKGEFEFAGSDYDLQLSRIYPEVRNGRFSVDMEFTGEVPEKIRIGQTFRIRLELGESRSAVLLPRGGFYQSTGGQWVYVVDPSGSFATKRNIRIGRQNPRFYEVLEGLEEGEKVIVSSYDNYGNVDKLILKK
jgi:HlyD family secretion protein